MASHPLAPKRVATRMACRLLIERDVLPRICNPLIFIVLAGCSVGDTSPSGGDPVDASPHGVRADAHIGSPDSGADAAPFACRDRVTSGLNNGHHNPGQDCQGSCHDHGFAMSGTLYSSATGGAPVAGVSITVMDAGGQVFDMVTSQNGNFWWNLTVQYPARVIASSCPTIVPMNMTLTSLEQGACSTSGCHAGAAGRVHL